MSDSKLRTLEDAELLSAADAAVLLGTKPSRIKQLIRDAVLVGRYSNGSWYVPAEVLIPISSELATNPKAEALRSRIADSVHVRPDEEPLPEATHVPLWSLSGTVTVLRDGGFSDEEILDWLFRSTDQLDQRPIDALLSGQNHEVNTVASTLAW